MVSLRNSSDQNPQASCSFGQVVKRQNFFFLSEKEIRSKRFLSCRICFFNFLVFLWNSLIFHQNRLVFGHFFRRRDFCCCSKMDWSLHFVHFPLLYDHFPSFLLIHHRSHASIVLNEKTNLKRFKSLGYFHCFFFTICLEV